MTETGASASRRGPYARSKVRQEQIATAVLSIVDELGHEAVTTALVAERAGIPEPSVLYHFPTKDHLLVAALQRADAEVGDVDDATLDLDELRRGLDAVHEDDAQSRRERLYAVMRGQSVNPDHPAAHYVRDRAEHAVRIWTRLIQRRQDDGLAHPGLDAEDVARQIYALWEGLGTLQRAGLPIAPGALLTSGIRLLSGANWMEFRAWIGGDAAGL